MAVSLNILGLPVPNVGALMDWCAAAKPPYAVVMDSLDIAARVRMVSPQTEIIYRKYRPDDSRLPDTTTPADFLHSIADVPAYYICQAGNENGGDQAQLAKWTVELIALANVQGRRLAVGSWSVGNPDEGMIASGVYDPMLRAIAGTKHVLSCHEYFHDKPLEEVYFVGRYAHFLQRADALAIAAPEIVITEHGRDLGGGADGWRSTGWSEADYADRLAQAQQVYNADEITACVFCWGDGFDNRWATYDVSDAPDLLRAMEAMNAGRQEDDMGLPGWSQAKTKQPGAVVNVRAQASITAPVVTTIRTDDWVKRLGTPVLNGGHRWQPIAVNAPNACPHGWVSLNVIDL